MTFNNAAYAIDGARTPAAAAREAVYTTGGGQSGVSQPADLRVTATSPNGPTLRINSGSAAVLNGYQTNPDQAYTISNPGPHITAEVDMPPAVPQTAYYLVCVVVGDPEFDQTGHPFMPSEMDPEAAATFQYVRPVILPCTSTTTTFEQLGKSYPGIALARLAIPANTTIITTGMITDVRVLAQPRQKREVKVGVALTNELESGGFEDFLGFTPMVRVPEWATRAIFIAHISGIMSTGTHYGWLRADIALGYGPSTPFDHKLTGSETERVSTSVAVSVDITGYGGQNVYLRVSGARGSAPGSGYYSVGPETSIVYDVQFTEDVI